MTSTLETHAAEQPRSLASELAHVAVLKPNELAVTDGVHSLTFGELEHRAATVGHRLIEAGEDEGAFGRVVRGSRWLPVIVDRTAASMVALQAAARAGMAFSPIEADLPVDRIAEVFHRLGDPKVALVADRQYLGLLPAGVRGIPVIDDQLNVRCAVVEVDPQAPGVVNFTSGSTGRPKAVVRPWNSFVRSMQSERARAAGIGSRRASQLRPFSFGAGLARVGRVSLGDSLHIIDPRAFDSDGLLNAIAEHELTDIHLGASLMATMLRGSNRSRRLPSVEVVRLGGEATPWDLIEPIFDMVSPDAFVQVGFAATEAGNMTRFEVRPGDPIGKGFVPLGRPVRPEMFRLAPVEGVDTAFEILVGDPQSIGFLDDPELDAARFTTDTDGVRWWCSGDLATVDDEGIVHHHGRIDSMVKVNGVLIEPGEVEAALRGIDGIADAAVVPKVAVNGSKRLIGHLVVDEDSLTGESVREQLLRRLPQALVPAMFVLHQQFPLTDRGKLDRRVLAETTWERWRSTEPRTGHLEQELWLASQVELILDLGEVGFDDDLWDLGLDSLGAVELCAAISDAGFPEMNPNQLLETRTVASLIAFLSSRECGIPSVSVVLNASGTRRPVFALPGGGGTALRFQALAQCLGEGQPVVVIEPQGMHFPGVVDRRIESMAAHAVNEIEERLDEGDHCVLMGFSAGATVAFETARQLHASGRSVELILLDAVPGGREKPAAEVTVSTIDKRPSFVRRLVGRGPLATARRLPALLAARGHRRILERYYLDPGPPSHDLDRYLAFRRIQSEAISAYQPEPLPIAGTLIRVANNPIESVAEPLFDGLRVVVVGGDHDSMLMHPHVADIAVVVVAANGSVSR